jgi:hypothetical protein
VDWLTSKSEIQLRGESTWDTGRAGEQHEPPQGHQVDALYHPITPYLTNYTFSDFVIQGEVEPSKKL